MHTVGGIEVRLQGQLGGSSGGGAVATVAWTRAQRGAGELELTWERVAGAMLKKEPLRSGIIVVHAAESARGLYEYMCLFLLFFFGSSAWCFHMMVATNVRCAKARGTVVFWSKGGIAQRSSR